MLLLSRSKLQTQLQYLVGMKPVTMAQIAVVELVAAAVVAPVMTWQMVTGVLYSWEP